MNIRVTGRPADVAATPWRLVVEGRMSVQANTYEDVSFYFRQIRNTKVLTREEESACATASAKGDREARDRLILSNLRYVVGVALRYRKRCGMPLLALINEGNMGLVKAASMFDPSRGFRFITYAKWWVKYYILKAITEHYGKGKDTGGAADGAEPAFSDGKAAGNGGAARRGEYAKSLARFPRHLSLDQLLAEEGDPEKSDHLVDRRSGTSPVEAALKGNLRDIINEALNKLKPIERDVIVRHFGLNGVEPSSMGEIGRSYNLTKERIRQIESAALDKLRYPMMKRRVLDYVE